MKGYQHVQTICVFCWRNCKVGLARDTKGAPLPAGDWNVVDKRLPSVQYRLAFTLLYCQRYFVIAHSRRSMSARNYYHKLASSTSESICMYAWIRSNTQIYSYISVSLTKMNFFTEFYNCEARCSLLFYFFSSLMIHSGILFYLFNIRI